MNQYRRVVDDIQTLIYSSTMVDRATVEPIAEEYRGVCTTINTRLRSVGQLLERGLRSEAIHQAEIEPSLLDVATALDFPELPQWLDLTTRLGLPRVPALLIDTAADINDAYADEKPLAGLLKTHRLLAIGRAPIAARISTLRKISKYDFKNAVWRDDLRDYEGVRFVEIRKEMEQACERNDLKSAKALKEELSDSEWVAEPPHQLIEHVDAQFASLFAGKSRERLIELASKLQTAMTSLDIELAEQLLPQWHQCATHARLGNRDPNAIAVQRVIEWVDQERAAQTEREEEEYKKQHELAQVEEFRASVRGNLPEKKLVQKRDSLRRAGVKMPKVLEGQYQERLKQFKRKRMILIASIAGGGVLVLVMTGVLIWMFAF